MTKRLRILWLGLALSVLSTITCAANYPGLIVERVWVKEGFVAVTFSNASDPNSLAACRSAYIYATDYKGVLGTLLAAKINRNAITIYEGSGGASLPSLIDSTVPNVWARPIAFVSLD